MNKGFQQGITLRHLRALVALSDLKLIARVSEALVMTALIAGIPVVGALLAGLLKSILLIFGIAQGALADMRRGELGARLENLMAQLMPLRDLSA